MSKKKISKQKRNYLKEVQAELAKVTWPTREEAIRLTILVSVVAAVSGVIISLLDNIFIRILQVIS